MPASPRDSYPELGHDEQVLTLAQPVLDSTLHALATLLLIAVIAGAIEQAVAGLDRVVDLVRAGILFTISFFSPLHWSTDG